MGLMRPMTTVFIVQRQFLLSESTAFSFRFRLIPPSPTWPGYAAGPRRCP